MKKLLVLLSLILLGINIKVCLGQENFVVVGGSSSAEKGSFSYSVGQIAYSFNSNLNGKISQGLQHPYEIYVVTGSNDELNISNEILLFPNPSSKYLNIKILNSNHKEVSFKLYDLFGNLLQNDKILNCKTSIDISFLYPSAYFIQILVDEAVVKTFRFIKN